METATGLRERKKAATRQAVHEAALRLTVDHGIENVTVDAIADVANISRRTFSNYFSSKEDALLYGEEQQIGALVQAVRDRPATESAWRALRNGAEMHILCQGSREEREWGIRARLAMRHPSLLARQLANHAALERDLADAVTGRPGTESARPRVVAAAFLGALRVATQLWIEAEGEHEITAMFREVLNEMAQPFT